MNSGVQGFPIFLSAHRNFDYNFAKFIAQPATTCVPSLYISLLNQMWLKKASSPESVAFNNLKRIESQ